jgi:hypothetical protein
VPIFLKKHNKYIWIIILSFIVIVSICTFIISNNTVIPWQPIYKHVPTPAFIQSTTISSLTPTFALFAQQTIPSSPPTVTLYPAYEVAAKVSTMVAPTTDPSLTANWLAYTNKEIGISFKYPPSFNSIHKNEELCWSNGDLVREYHNQLCIGIELATVASNGKTTFLVSQSKLFPKHRLGRGAYWGDLSAALAENAEVNVRKYCTDYNPLRIACSVSINSNSVLFTKRPSQWFLGF